MTVFLIGYGVVFFIAWVLFTAELMKDFDNSDYPFCVAAGGVLSLVWPLTVLGALVLVLAKGIAK